MSPVFCTRLLDGLCFSVFHNEGYMLSTLVLWLLIDVLKFVLMREWKVISTCLFVCYVLFCFRCFISRVFHAENTLLCYSNKTPAHPLLIARCKDEPAWSLSPVNVPASGGQERCICYALLASCREPWMLNNYGCFTGWTHGSRKRWKPWEIIIIV